jgi:signal recognition particle receptor subunit beta
MSTKIYYIAPSDKIFEEVKAKAIEIWQGYDNEFGYADEKVGRIKDIGNISDNLMFIVAMFDFPNQQKLARKLSVEARDAIRERMFDGGQPEEYNPF